MKKITIIITLVISILSLSVAQTTHDPKAKEILDKLSLKLKAYTTIRAEFINSIENKLEGIDEAHNGSIMMKGDKYNLKIMGQNIISDGKTVWNYISDANEVQIDNAPTEEEKMEEESVINPATIFTFYEKGFKFQYTTSVMMEGKRCHLIKLHPIKPEDKAYHTIKLIIEEESLEMKMITILGKEGGKYKYQITRFQSNTTIPDKLFLFDKSRHPGIEVVDLRM